MKQPKDMDVNELKVLAYDMLASIQKLQQDSVVINNLIIQKQNTVKDNQKKIEK